MSDTYPTLVHRWFEEVWNQGNEGAIDELLAPDVLIHGIGDSPDVDLIGPEEFKTYFRKFRGAFPAIRTTIMDTVIETGKMVARFSVHARHEGDGFGFLPTKNAIQFSGVVIVHVRGGRISEAWNYIDFASMYHQLAAK